MYRERLIYQRFYLTNTVFVQYERLLLCRFKGSKFDQFFSKRDWKFLYVPALIYIKPVVVGPAMGFLAVLSIFTNGLQNV